MPRKDKLYRMETATLYPLQITETPEGNLEIVVPPRVPLTYEQVGICLGLSHERVRQIEKVALAKLGRAMLKNNISTENYHEYMSDKVIRTSEKALAT